MLSTKPAVVLVKDSSLTIVPADTIAQAVLAHTAESEIRTSSSILQSASLLISALSIIFLIVNIFISLWSRSEVSQRMEQHRRDIDARLRACSEAHEKALDQRIGQYEKLRDDIENKVRARGLEILEERKRAEASIVRTAAQIRSYIAFSLSQGLKPPPLDAYGHDRLLGLFSTDAATCQDAVYYFGEYGGKEVLPFLERVAREFEAEEVRVDARKAVDRIRGREGQTTSS